MRKLLLFLLFSIYACAQTTIGGAGTSFPMIQNGPPPNCFIGVPYTFSALANGGVLPLAWSTNPSVPVPGLGTINSSTGVIGGSGASCTTPGTYQFQLIVTDAAGNQASVTFSITAVNKLTISAPANPQGEVGLSYTSSTPSASGGVGSYAWSCPGCVIPPGLGPINPSTGVFTGTPTAQGTYPLVLQVQDANGNTATASTPIIVIPGVSITSGGPPTPATQNVAYPAYSVVAQGGVAPLTYGLTSGSSALPTGLSINSSTGAVTGTPTVLGTTNNIFFQVTDSATPTHSVAVSGPFTIVVAAAPPALQFTNTPCGPGTVNVPYACQLAAAGGTGTGYAYTLNSGSNPPNTTLNGSSGLISGTPLSATTVTPQYKVTDSGSNTATQSESITIAPSTGCGPPLYKCSTTVQTVIQAPPPPFTTPTGQNQIKCDPSLNGACSSTSGIDPIVRATDSTTGSTGFTIDPSGGSGDNIFALDDSKIAVIPQNSGSTCVLAFNPTTMQLSNPCTTIPFTHSVHWSHTNANVLYGIPTNTPNVPIGGTTCKAPCVVKTTFSSPTMFTQSVVVDPTVACSALIPSGVYTGGSITLSSDDNIVYGALLTSGQNSVGYAFAYNQSNGQCSALYTGSATNNVLFYNGTVSTATFPCAPIGLHNTNIFKNGTYGRMSTGPIGSCTNVAEYWQIGTANVFSCGAGTGHNSNGWNLDVIISNPTFHYANVNSGTFCTDLNSQTYGSGLWLSNGQTGDIENHFNLNYITAAETQPIVGGTAYANNPGTTWVAPYVNELWAFQRSPFLLQRVTHLFNSSSVTCTSCDFRDIFGIVTQSQTGKFAAFCSDMINSLGSSSNGQRIDVFIVRLD